jgi:hypothetical protein
LNNGEGRAISLGMPKLDPTRLKMFLVPCSCGTTFAVSENYDRQGTAWSRYLKCPGCSKRHDPKNRLLLAISEKAIGRSISVSRMSS